MAERGGLHELPLDGPAEVRTEVGAHEPHPPAALVDVERVLPVGVARVAAVEVVADLPASDDDESDGGGAGAEDRTTADGWDGGGRWMVPPP